MADDLAVKMRQAIREVRGLRVTRPLKRAKLRLQGMDDSITKEELAESVAGVAGCRIENLALGEIKSPLNRLRSVWLRCPVAVSNKFLEEERWRVRWAKPLPACQMRCFRCLEAGHAATKYEGVDRSDRCHRCGDRTHQSRSCPSGRPEMSALLGLWPPGWACSGGVRMCPQWTCRAA